MTCLFSKKTFIRMRGREETRISCTQGIHTWDLPARCDDCSMRYEDHAIVCEKCGLVIENGRAQAWIGGFPYCAKCVKEILGIPNQKEGDE